jgi:CRISPR/Cas system CSM-associated protein Csm2 small subunit
MKLLKTLELAVHRAEKLRRKSFVSGESAEVWHDLIRELKSILKSQSDLWLLIQEEVQKVKEYSEDVNADVDWEDVYDEMRLQYFEDSQTMEDWCDILRNANAQALTSKKVNLFYSMFKKRKLQEEVDSCIAVGIWNEHNKTMEHLIKLQFANLKVLKSLIVYMKCNYCDAYSMLPWKEVCDILEIKE